MTPTLYDLIFGHFGCHAFSSHHSDMQDSKNTCPLLQIGYLGTRLQARTCWMFLIFRHIFRSAV